MMQESKWITARKKKKQKKKKMENWKQNRECKDWKAKINHYLIAEYFDLAVASVERYLAAVIFIIGVNLNM